MIRDREAAHAAPVHQVPNLADHVPDASVPRGGPEGLMAGGTAGGAHPRGQDRGRSRCPSPRSGRPQLPAITAARGVALQVHEVPRGGTLDPRWSRGRAPPDRSLSVSPTGTGDRAPGDLRAGESGLQDGCQGHREALLRFPDEDDVGGAGLERLHGVPCPIPNQGDPHGVLGGAEAASDPDQVLQATLAMAPARQDDRRRTSGPDPICGGGFAEAFESPVEDAEAVEAKLPKTFVRAHGTRHAQELGRRQGLSVADLTRGGCVGEEERHAGVLTRDVTDDPRPALCCTHAGSLGSERGRSSPGERLSESSARDQSPESLTASTALRRPLNSKEAPITLSAPSTACQIVTCAGSSSAWRRISRIDTGSASPT